MSSAKRMADGKQWTTFNLNVATVPSYCYEDLEQNCRLYGRLYTWESARRACQSLGDGWRLPTNDEWQKLAKQYGGVRDDSDDGGKAAYQALVIGGGSGFNAVFGGGRSHYGQYGHDCKPMDSTGQRQKMACTVHGSITLVRLAFLIVTTMARS